MTNYERIARVIQYLDASHTDQPTLNELADRVGLSPFHFQRLFLEWAGVTPKEFLQCLTHSYAKHRLLAGASVLDTSLDVGLSGPGRLHDLCVKLEAATPGEIKSGGEGWELVGGFFESPFGRMLVVESPRGICHVAFVDAGANEAALHLVREDWPAATLRIDEERAHHWSHHLFERGDGKTVRAYVRGTAFQVQVWQALLRVPEGVLVSYGDLAQAVGKPAASRAVGTAVGRNPLAYLIPCHRVIRETGAVGAYRWGATRKRIMLAKEQIVTLDSK